MAVGAERTFYNITIARCSHAHIFDNILFIWSYSNGTQYTFSHQGGVPFTPSNLITVTRRANNIIMKATSKKIILSKKQTWLSLHICQSIWDTNKNLLGLMPCIVMINWWGNLESSEGGDWQGKETHQDIGEGHVHLANKYSHSEQISSFPSCLSCLSCLSCWSLVLSILVWCLPSRVLLLAKQGMA